MRDDRPMRDPLTFLRDELVPLLDAGLAELRGVGTEPASAPPGFTTVREALSVTLRGAPEQRVFLVLRDGLVHVADTVPADCLTRYACALPGAALGLWVEQYGAQFEPARLAGALARLCHPRVLAMFAANPVSFELNVAAVPDLGPLQVTFALGRAELPTASDFRLSVAYPDLIQARLQGLTPQQLLASGKLRLEGDVARAMGLGMMLMQLKRVSDP
jgi:hypothetical protein